MLCVSWNVNSVRVRLEALLEWMEKYQPDVLMLQEIKVQKEEFPFQFFEDRGYFVFVHGQKSYNGVALISKHPLKDIRFGFPRFEDGQARYIEGCHQGTLYGSVYCPNGNPVYTDPVQRLESEKFQYKLRWMETFYRYVEYLMRQERSFVLGGDYNICPEDRDLYNSASFEEDALCHIKSRSWYRRVLNLGVVEAFRVFHEEGNHYTFWDYKHRAWENNRGLRIDHFLVSPDMADRLENCWIDPSPRANDRPSDHAPVLIHFHEAEVRFFTEKI